MSPPAGPDHPLRRYPVACIGDRFGPYVVIALLPRARGRSDERVRYRCDCGHEADTYVYNLRKAKVCMHARRARR